jgi:hypothetical protein
MSDELSITGSFQTAPGGAIIKTGNFATKLDVSGLNATQSTKIISQTSTTLEKGDVSTIGYLFIRNITPLVIPELSNVRILQGGSPGLVHYTYQIVAYNLYGGRSAPLSITTTLGNATLDGTNFNQLLWDEIDNVDHYKIYRVASAGSPSSIGFLTTVNAGVNVYDDQGAAASNSFPVDAGDIGHAIVFLGPNDGNTPFRLDKDDFMLARWNDTDVTLFSEVTGEVSLDPADCLVDYVMIED